MSGSTLPTIGIVIPSDFPAAHYEAIIERVRNRNGRNPIDAHVLSQFLGAWNGVAYRFRSCAEHDAVYTESVNRAGVAPPVEERYVQERELFGFFVTGLAVIESIAYGLFAVGAMLDAANFPMLTPSDMRRVSPKFTADKLTLAFPSENIAAALNQVLVSQEFIDWSNARNILAHRASPGRLLTSSATFGLQTGNVTNIRDEAVWQDIQIQIDNDTTTTRRVWMAKTASDILAAADIFTSGHL